MSEQYVSPCTAHFYQNYYEHLDSAALKEQRRVLEEALLAIAEQQEEFVGVGGRQEQKLRQHFRREQAQLTAKLAAIGELISRRR